MSQRTTLWKQVLERHPKLEAALSADSEEDSEPAVNDDPVNDRDVDDPFADFDLEFNVGDSDPFKDFNPEFDIEDPKSAVNDDPAEDPFKDFNPEFDDEQNDASANAGASVLLVDRDFEDSADLWLTQARTGLEPALSAMGIGFSEIFPTKRPLLIFGSHRTEVTEPEYHRVEVKREGWPCCLHSTERLTVNAAAEILASSADEARLTESPPYFEGETVAVEVPNPLLATDRWIVMWPILASLPEESAKLHQWERVRRVVWCVDREQIGRRDTLDWLSRFWQDTPIRIALFRAASFVDEKEDVTAQSKRLPRIRYTLEKFDRIKGHPWIVVGP